MRARAVTLERLGVQLVLGVALASCGESALQTQEAGDELLVGVTPYGIEDVSCAQGPDQESAYVSMDDENDSLCSYQSGDQGEGSWVSPEAVKYPIPEPCMFQRTHTTLRFCRRLVAATAFRPLTTDPEAAERFYAILKFGERCPANSVEISKRIVNEDESNLNEPVPAGNLLSPNEVADDARGNYTKLVFCFFEHAPSEAETMQEFPDLGFPYAVFHDFEGPQPSFIIRKRWQHSDDSNRLDPTNSYEPDESDPDTAAFQRIIENPVRGGTPDTYFELGRVR